MVVGIARDLVRTQDQLGPKDPTNLVFKLLNDEMPVIYGTSKTVRENIGNAFTLGHATNGILGTANGVGGGQLTLGSGGLGSTTLARVTSLNQTFVEAFRDQEYTDTDLTTATVNTTDNTVTF